MSSRRLTSRIEAILARMGCNNRVIIFSDIAMVDEMAQLRLCD